MKKLGLLSLGLCVALAFTSCKSSESAYKKAYEKAKQQELAESQNTQEEAPAVEPCSGSYSSCRNYSCCNSSCS